jgi:serine/threonine protein kinase
MTIHGQATAGIMARLLFKSSKVIPTTIMEILFLRGNSSSSSSSSASTSLKKLVGCGLLTLGCLVYFSEGSIHGDSHTSSSTDWGANALFGMMLLLGASLLDSALTILESKLLFGKASRCHVTVVEAAFGFSTYGLLMLVIACMVGVLPLEVQSMPLSAVDSVAFCICSSIAYALTFYFIASGGPAYSESFKVFRKIAVLVGFAFTTSTALSGRAAAALVLCCLGLYLVDSASKGLPSIAKWSNGSLNMRVVSMQRKFHYSNNRALLATVTMMVLLLSMGLFGASPAATGSYTTVSLMSGSYNRDYSNHRLSSGSFQCPVCPVISSGKATLFSQQYQVSGYFGKGGYGTTLKVIDAKTGGVYLTRFQNGTQDVVFEKSEDVVVSSGGEYNQQEEINNDDSDNPPLTRSINCLEAARLADREQYTSRIAQKVWCGPNLMKLHDVVISDKTGEDVLIWELFDGQTVNMIAHNHPDAEITRNITCKLLQGLASLNCKGYAHNDLHTGNILYNEDTGDLRLIDNELVGRSPCRQPRRRQRVGGVYRFGELLQLEVDNQQDVWAAGIAFSQLLFGNKGPFWSSSGKRWEDRILQIVCALGKEGFSEFVHKRNVTRVLESEELLSELSKCPGGRMDWRQFDEKGRAGEDALELLNAMLTYDPAERPAAAELLDYEYCRGIPLPQ